MLKDARENILLPKLQKLIIILQEMSDSYASIPMFPGRMVKPHRQQP